MDSDCTSADARDCAEVLEALHAYLDGELDRERIGAVEVHLEACRRCGLEADTFRYIKALIRGGDNGLDRETLLRVRRFAAGLLADASR